MLVTAQALESLRKQGASQEEELEEMRAMQDDYEADTQRDMMRLETELEQLQEELAKAQKEGSAREKAAGGAAGAAGKPGAKPGGAGGGEAGLHDRAAQVGHGQPERPLAQQRPALQPADEHPQPAAGGLPPGSEPVPAGFLH